MYMNPYTAGQFAHPPAQRTAPTPNLRHVFEDPQWLAAGQNSPMLPPQSQQSDVNYAPATMAAFPRSAGEIANTIACSAVTLTKTSERVKCFDHPSIPRLQPYDVEVDLAQRASGPPHFVPVSRLSMRPTYGVIPATNVLADSLQLPIGLHLHPFAESEIPLVDVGRMGISEIVRCRKCSAYINPFTTFTEGGRQWQCIMCKTMHITEEAYRCNMDPQTGLRTDIMDRPELFHCAVDFVATKSFLKRPPMRPTQLILLDCTFAAVQSGILQSMCTGALRALEAMKDDEVMRMGVVGFDSTVYFFNLRPSLSKPRMMAAPDTVADIVNVNDAFKLDPIELPCSISELVVPIKDSYHLLKDLFENLPQMLRDTKEVECAFGPALAAAITLTENSGAKILASLCSIPSSGDGKLKARFDVSKMSGQPKENTMCHAANDWYKQRALACSNSFISIDLVVNGSNNVDLATVAPLARFTSGSIFRVNAVSIGGLSEQVEYSLTRFLAFEAILRVRTSKGLMVPNFYGHCHVQKPELLALPVANADSTYAIELALGPDFKGSYAYIQYAVLYTSRARERLIRVHTVQLPVSLVLAQVVSSINSIGMATFLAKMAVDLAVKDPYKTAQERITSKLVTALANIKDNMQKRGVVAGAGQLLLPESMKFIPQIVSSFFKFEAISVPHPQSLVQPDERVASMALVMTAPPESLLTFFLGWTYQLFAPNLSVEQQPCMVPSSQSCLCADGIYLMNLGRAIVIWVGDRSDSRVVEAFGITPANANGQNQRVHLSEEDLVGLRERVETVIWQQKVLAQSAYCGALEICHKGNTIIEPTLTRAMTEDDSPVKSTYSTYLLSLWEGVNKAMEGKK